MILQPQQRTEHNTACAATLTSRVPLQPGWLQQPAPPSSSMPHASSCPMPAPLCSCPAAATMLADCTFSWCCQVGWGQVEAHLQALHTLCLLNMPHSASVLGPALKLGVLIAPCAGWGGTAGRRVSEVGPRAGAGFRAGGWRHAQARGPGTAMQRGTGSDKNVSKDSVAACI